MSLVRNEQTKLTATLLNGVAVAAVAVGVIAPVTAALIGTASFAVAFITSTIWLTAAAALQIGARPIPRRLAE